MLYLFAAVGVITVAVLLWRAFGVQPSQESTPRGGRGPRSGRARRISAPDDDPEFLRRLDEQNRSEGDH